MTAIATVTAANPAYQQYNPATDIKGIVTSGQRIRVVMSSAKGDQDDPLRPDLSTELTPFEVALIEYKNGATAVTVTGDMRNLNLTPGVADREAFVRVQGEFDYDNGVEAALGPFAMMDSVKISYSFNG